jgi:uncharacterized membrane protein
MSNRVESEESGRESAARAALTIGLAVAITALDGLALMLIWRWHVVPVFGAPVLTFVRAFAIVVMVRLFCKHAARTAPRGDAWRSEVWRLALGRVIADAASVALAYLAWLLS